MLNARILTVPITLAILAAVSGPAGASTTIGQTWPQSSPCNLGNVLFQASTAGGASYAVPAGGGVITSWSTHAGNTIGAMKLVIVRPLAANQYLVVAASPAQDLFPNHLNTFTLSPGIAVQGGDLLGLRQTSCSPTCAFKALAGDMLLRTDSGIDPPAGTIFVPFGDVPSTRVNVTATVEPTPSSPAPTTPPATIPPATIPPSTSSPSTSPLPPTEAFAGVRLVSTRLAMAGRFIPLKLSCPSGTVGGCWGQTKLTAPRRRAGSRAASTVVLGRASFSIAAGEQARVGVRVSRAGRRLLGRVRRLRGRDSNAARDGAGRSKTTAAAVTIRRRHS